MNDTGQVFSSSASNVKCQISVDSTNVSVTAAAKKLGISRRTLHRKINEMNLAKTSKTTGRSATATEAPPRE